MKGLRSSHRQSGGASERCRHKKGRLAYVPDSDTAGCPQAVFTADVESHHEFAVNYESRAGGGDLLSRHRRHARDRLLAVAAFDGSAELDLDRTSESDRLSDLGSSSADHDVVGLAVGRSTARAEVTSDPKNSARFRTGNPGALEPSPSYRRNARRFDSPKATAMLRGLYPPRERG